MDTGVSFFLGTIGNIIGAFVGFGLALILQRRTDRKIQQEKDKETCRIQREKVNKIIKCVTEELDDIGHSIKVYIDISKTLKQRIHTPVWDSILSSGIILDFIDEPKYKNLIKVYSLIKTYNELLSSTFTTECDLFEVMKEILDVTQTIY